MDFEPDRSGFREALAGAIAEREGQSHLAAVLIRLDDFHKVNTRYGYDVGDAVIQTAFTALQSTLREPIRLYRVGGTRFAFIVPNVKYPDLVRIGMERALSAINSPLELAGASVSPTGVAAAALCPESGDSADQLFLNAELALQGADPEEAPIVIHCPGEQQHRQDRWQLELDLKDALGEGQLLLHYQPQIALQDFSPVGFEALMRWHHPRQGMISPDVFIPLAERSSLINDLTEWVMQTSLRQTAGLQMPGRKTKVSVNVSPVTLFDGGFPYAIESALSLWGGTHEQLVLEVTERTLVHDTEASKRVLNALRDKGVRVAIDDFGTGYSSLSYIKQLAVDELKIDKSFITHIADNEVDLKLVDSIVDVGHKLGLEVVAEGVEDERALNLLRELGCDVAQGFLLSHPLEAADIADWYRGARSANTA